MSIFPEPARAEHPLCFSIDFDGTWNADADAFRVLATYLRDRGHTVIVTTQRCIKYDEEIKPVIGLDWLPIIYASGQSKEAAALKAGHIVDVWIDDSPYSVSTALTYRGCE